VNEEEREVFIQFYSIASSCGIGQSELNGSLHSRQRSWKLHQSLLEVSHAFCFLVEQGRNAVEYGILAVKRRDVYIRPGVWRFDIDGDFIFSRSRIFMDGSKGIRIGILVGRQDGMRLVSPHYNQCGFLLLEVEWNSSLDVVFSSKPCVYNELKHFLDHLHFSFLRGKVQKEATRKKGSRTQQSHPLICYKA